jgi:hypothetical protein
MGRSRALGAVIVASLALAAPAVAAEPLVKIDRTGGFPGVHELLKVKTDRSAVLRDGSGPRDRFRVSRTRMKNLRAALRDARWSTLAPEYRSPVEIPDGYRDAITHAGRTVRTETGADPPRRLERVVSILQRIIASR